MAKSFEAQVTSWARKSEARMLAVAQTAAQDMAEEMQTTRDKGGRMPVDTGYLRNSGMADIGKMPSGESSPGNMRTVVLAINKMKLGDTLYFGWVANYAKYMEAKYAFMRTPAQKWGRFVKLASRRIEQSGSGLRHG